MKLDPMDFPVKIVKMTQCKLKQGLQEFKLIIEDLVNKEVIMPTAPPFNSQALPVLRPLKT